MSATHFCQVHSVQLANECQFMTTSRPWEVTEPAVFVPDVARKHDVFARAFASGA